MKDLALQLEWAMVTRRCSHLHEIRRSLMPQIKTGDMARAFDLLRQYARVSKGSASAGSLKQMQRDIDWHKVDGIVAKWKARGQDPAAIKPIVVSRDRSIVDGHHRWAAVLKGWGKDVRVPIWQIDLAADQALKVYMSVAKKFAEGIEENIEKVGEPEWVRRYDRYGYVLKRERWRLKDDDSDLYGTPITAAYTLDGDYIGSPQMAHFLCVKMGIRPEKISPEHNVCTIGFCKKDQKWYGWSHRAIRGFWGKTLDDAKRKAIVYAKSVS